MARGACNRTVPAAAGDREASAHPFGEGPLHDQGAVSGRSARQATDRSRIQPSPKGTRPAVAKVGVAWAWGRVVVGVRVCGRVRAVRVSYKEE